MSTKKDYGPIIARRQEMKELAREKQQTAVVYMWLTTFIVCIAAIFIH